MTTTKYPKFARNLSICLAIVIALLAPVKAQETADDVVIGEPYITEIIVDDAAQTVLVKGELGDSCTELGEIQQTVEDTTIQIEIQTVRPADAMCAMILATFEETITLDTEGLEPGQYTVQVLDITDTFFVLPEPVVCSELEATESHEIFSNDRICFLYPAAYVVVSNQSLILMNSKDLIDSQRITLLIQIDAESELTTLEEIQNQLVENQTDTEWDFEKRYLGGERALFVDSLDGTRYLYLLHEGVRYTLSLQPISEQYPDATETAESFWADFTATWGFSDDNGTE